MSGVTVTITGGDKLKAALEKIAKRAANSGKLKVGFMSDATYPDGTSVALVAATQNFGAPSRGIPPRPFFSNMVKDKSPEWGPAIAKLLVANDYDAQRTLATVGDQIKEQLQAAIIATDSPPLKPATVKRKGSDKPLIEHGDMLAAVTSEVESK